jgi:hypothetical protein
MTIKIDILIVILGILFLIRAGLDHAELMEDLEEMRRLEEEEQRENDCAGAAAEDKGRDVQ